MHPFRPCYLRACTVHSTVTASRVKTLANLKAFLRRKNATCSTEVGQNSWSRNISNECRQNLIIYT